MLKILIDPLAFFKRHNFAVCTAPKAAEHRMAACFGAPQGDGGACSDLIALDPVQQLVNELHSGGIRLWACVCALGRGRECVRACKYVCNVGYSRLDASQDMMGVWNNA